MAIVTLGGAVVDNGTVEAAGTVTATFTVAP
jgi:hypothetical protein